MTIIIGIMCFILVYVMFIQFKTIKQTDITAIENMRESELRAEITSWKNKYEELDAKYQDTIAKIDEYQSKIETNQEASELLKEELQQSNMILGKSAVKGEGIIITLKDTEEANVTYDMLLELINSLIYGEAEAISINDQRVINTTDLAAPTGDAILINANSRTHIYSPYVIKAIGNQTLLESNLKSTDGFINKYNKRIDISLDKDKNIEILPYNGEMKLEYAKDK